MHLDGVERAARDLDLLDQRAAGVEAEDEERLLRERGDAGAELQPHRLGLEHLHRARPIDEGAGARYGAEVAAKVHQEVRRLGGVAPPREFVLIDRSAIGLGSVFMHLRATLNWHRMFESLIKDFDEARLAKRQADALEAAGVPEAL